MPAVYFFLIDVSMNAIETGATAAACSAIAQAISDLPVSCVLDFCSLPLYVFFSHDYHSDKLNCSTVYNWIFVPLYCLVCCRV
jgi:hypothetical protein